MDLIIGKDKQDTILTLIDRVSGFTIIERKAREEDWAFG